LKSKIILYLGIDQRYWRNFKLEIQETYPDDKFTFEDGEGLDIKNYRKILREVLKIPPNILLVDYSGNSEPFLKLTTLLRRLNVTKNIATLGPYSQAEYPQTVRDCLSAGVIVNVLKSGDDFHDLIFHACSLHDNDGAKDPGFFKLASDKGDESYLVEVCRLNYIDSRVVVLNLLLLLLKKKLSHSIVKSLKKLYLLKSTKLNLLSLHPFIMKLEALVS
jgi:hypothetical protein